MLLSQLLPHIDVLECDGDRDVEVCHVTRDSRQVRNGSIFVAIRGSKVDGHAFVHGLREAAAVVVEESVEVPKGVCRVRVSDCKRALPLLAAAIHGFPGKQLHMVGVTGTNGKTTVTTLIDSVLREMNQRSGRIGTTGTYVDGRPVESLLTTPESTELQHLLADMRDEGLHYVAMEVSSIGLVQRRVDGVEFNVGVFTNLSRDHLDFHGTMEDYRDAKARLFSDLLAPAGALPRALVCGDDPAHRLLGLPQDVWRYGFDEGCELRIDNFSMDADGISFGLSTPVGEFSIRSPLVGKFNALNLTAAFGVCVLLNFRPAECADALSKVGNVPGRMERVPNRHGLLVLVDYAHSPDALKKVLDTVSEASDGDVWVVFGCGGDRDQGKRSEMGRIAEEGAKHVVVTSDNPRGEDPLQIVDEILSGMSRAPAHVDVARDRAIAWTLRQAVRGDVVVIAGKGHENYQEIAGVRTQFDDREVCERVMEAM